MTRLIRGISQQLAHTLCKELPRIGVIEYHIGDDLVDLALDGAVILKAYDDHVCIDLGGKLAFISSNDFRAIAMV